ncbi:MAG: S46 family peptidase [Bacteroidales bacterium]|nr:S46 family peptidase [Bacteroidales bacterium]
MKKILLVFSFALCLNPIFADEGMWLLTMLDKLGIQQKGCKLTPEQIYSINKSSLKDAVLGLANSENPYSFFCTSELVSSQGLLLTNYHCGFEMIQQHSTLTSNYMDNGFWAKNQSEELTNEGIVASRMVAMYDVTERVLEAKAAMRLGLQDTATVDTVEVGYDEDNEEFTSLSSVFEAIRKSVTDTCSYGASVKSFFEGNQYFLFVYETYKDVRLVGAPPRSIGKFGDETDNWVWPRHTGDFCVLRVYTDESGLPAEYSQKNKPLSPKHFLPISLKGVKEGDYAMILGFPGSTDRYRSADDIRYFQEIDNATLKLIGDVSLNVYKKYMNQDSLIRIKYASKYDNLSNYWKYSIGQNKGINDLKVVEKKYEQEKAMKEWIQADSSRIAKYGNVIDSLSGLFYDLCISNSRLTFMNVGLLNVVEAFMFTYDCMSIVDALETGDPVIVKEVQVSLKDKAKKFFNDYDAMVDKNQFISLTLAAAYNMDFNIYSSKNFILNKKYKGDVAKYADYVFSKSIFTDPARLDAFLDKPDRKKFVSDPMFELLRYTLYTYFSYKDAVVNPRIDMLNTLYVDMIMKMNPDSVMYPDANSTLRLTYGSVESYVPKDGMTYHYYTTMKGILEKKDDKNPEFFVPEKLEELYNAKDFGQYADKNGDMPVCFLTTNDITGGNSGSPVINANGELIGIAFDGNWEAMSGDIIFEPSVQRTIAVDIRYVLFVIDKFAGAGYLLDELTLVK